MEKPTYWARLWAGKRDYVYHRWQEIITPQFKYDDYMIAYWQSWFVDGKMACTLISAITAFWNNCWIKLTDMSVNRLIQEAKKEWFSPEKGWRIEKAMNFVKRFIFREFWIRLKYHRVDWQDFKYLTSKWFHLSWGYRNLKWVTADKMKDWILWNDWQKYWAFRLWHCHNFFEFDWRFSWLDQYKWKTRYNIFEIQNLKELVENNVIFPQAYFFENLDEVRKWYQGYLKDKIEKLKDRKEVRKLKIIKALEKCNQILREV